ncbi:hypothetical protein EVG20_g3173 [Dentipellis fragilis]|uniref:Uncharacterized protein n=1 Tax=Dentipellis fragilis TaxID=205917 RepID=A0A4Y9Z5I9_9AGAM|nr:hypothetical protein EVG20_g3173 [Dentipellis fragilis]
MVELASSLFIHNFDEALTCIRDCLRQHLLNMLPSPICSMRIFRTHLVHAFSRCTAVPPNHRHTGTNIRGSQTTDGRYASSSKLLPTPNRKRRRPWFSTLDPTRLTPSDFCIISAKNRARPFREYRGVAPFQFYYSRLDGKPKFPPGTQGFFYYASPSRGSGPDEHGEVRFRVTPGDDVMDFAAGQDLLYPDGLPWKVTLGRIALHKTYNDVSVMLLRDNLVTEEMLAAIRDGTFKYQRSPNRRLVSRIGQPFSVDLSRRHWLLNVVIGAEVRLLRTMNPFWHPAAHRGRMICCFEHHPQDRPERPGDGSPRLVIRVLKIVDLIMPPIASPQECAMDPPTEGALLTKAGNPYFLSVLSSKALRLLVAGVEQKAPVASASEPPRKELNV